MGKYLKMKETLEIYLRISLYERTKENFKCDFYPEGVLFDLSTKATFFTQ